MRRIVFFLLLTLSTHHVNAQKDFEKYVNVLSTIPSLFLSWLENIDKIAQHQDKQKFLDLSKELLADLGKLRNNKEQLLLGLESDELYDYSYNQKINALKTEVKKIRLTLEDSENLARRMTGTTTIIALSDLENDIDIKEFLLQGIYGSSPKRTELKNVLVTNIKRSIAILDGSVNDLSGLIKELEQ